MWRYKPPASAILNLHSPLMNLCFFLTDEKPKLLSSSGEYREERSFRGKVCYQAKPERKINQSQKHYIAS